MINEVRNSTGFANFAAAKKLKARAPYSSKFQPLEAEVEAVHKADMVEPYSVEQSLRAFDEEAEEPNSGDENKPAEVDDGRALRDGISETGETNEQSQLYSSTGPLASEPTPAPPTETGPAHDEPLDDQAIIDTVISNLSEKIETSFNALETDIAQAIEMRLGRALLDAFKHQLAEETSQKLKQAISEIIAERENAKVNISGPTELIELFQEHLGEDENKKARLSFSVDEASSDLIVQIDELSITSRFNELDNLVSELFQ